MGAFVFTAPEQHVDEHEPDAEHRDDGEPDREPDREAGSRSRFAVLLQKIAAVDARHGELRLFHRRVNSDWAHGFDLVRGDEIAAALTRRRGVTDAAGKMLRVAARRTQREEVEAAQRIGWYLLLAAAVMLIGEAILADRITIRQ